MIFNQFQNVFQHFTLNPSSQEQLILKTQQYIQKYLRSFRSTLFSRKGRLSFIQELQQFLPSRQITSFYFKIIKNIISWDDCIFTSQLKSNRKSNILNLISHIKFNYLMQLDLSNIVLSSIQVIAHLQCPYLQKIILYDTRILNIKPLAKTNWNKLRHLNLSENQFDQNQLIYLSRMKLNPNYFSYILFKNFNQLYFQEVFQDNYQSPQSRSQVYKTYRYFSKLTDLSQLFKLQLSFNNQQRPLFQETITYANMKFNKKIIKAFNNKLCKNKNYKFQLIQQTQIKL